MNGEELKGVIEEYLRDSKAEYAVMIDGDWGSGKTYFLTHSLTDIIEKLDEENDEQRRYAYVSLYGVKSTSEVSKEIMFQYLGNKKSNKFKVASNILTASLGAFNIDFTKVEEILQMNISNWIICFDDLERCCFSINEMLGYINQLVEHNNCKVIVLANEKEIGKITLNSNLESKYQVVLSGRKYEFEKKDCAQTSEPNEEIDMKTLKKETENLFNEDILYGSIKEKVIGLKINYEPQMVEVYDSIISDFVKDSGFYEYLKKNRARILNYFKEENCNNLRTLISVLKSIKKVYEEMVKDSYNTDPYFERIMNEFVKYIALFTIYYKKGGNKKDLHLTTEIGHVRLGQNIYSQTRAFKFLEKYCVSLNFSKDEFTRTVVLLRKEYDEEEKRKKKARLGMAVAYEKLRDWWEKEDDIMAQLSRQKFDVFIMN
ncbi:MAG: P-loop NTPase fold protein [Anaerobutyricum sp.]